MKVLYIAPEYPNHGMNAAQVRANAVLSRLPDHVDLRILAFPPHGRHAQAQDCRKVVPVDRRRMTSVQMMLGTVSATPRAFRRFDTRSARTALAAELGAFQPEVVHFDTIGSLGLLDVVLSAAPRPKIVAQTHDAVSELYAALIKSGSIPARLNSAWERKKIRRFEARRLQCADLVLVDSPEDAAYLRQLNSANTVATLPLGFDNRTFGATGPDVALAEPSLVFSGSFGSVQSIDAAHFLVGEIMPRIWRTHPEANVYLVGANPDNSVQALASERVHVTGFVDDLSAYLRAATLYVCPLRLGSGMRTRVVEALACGTAMITTRKSVRGLNVPEGDEPPWITADTADTFADAVGRALAANCAPLRTRAAAYAHAHYSWDSVVAQLANHYRQLGEPASHQA